MGDVSISSIGCPLYRRTRVACISTSRADLLRYPMRRLNSALHPPIPSGRMFTRKEDPAFSASIDRNPVQFARTERRKTAALPRTSPGIVTDAYDLPATSGKRRLRFKRISRCPLKAEVRGGVAVSFLVGLFHSLQHAVRPPSVRALLGRTPNSLLGPSRGRRRYGINLTSCH